MNNYNRCVVDTENEFTYDGFRFKISEEVKEYEVHKKSGTIYDYTNEAEMSEVYVVSDEYGFTFFNQVLEEIPLMYVEMIS